MLVIGHRRVQYLFDAGESEAWMSEQELHMISEERARDEVGAGNMLKKHANMEKTVDDYADVVRHLAERAQQLTDQDHPDRYITQATQHSTVLCLEISDTASCFLPTVLTVALLVHCCVCRRRRLSSVMLCIGALYTASSHTRDTGKQINIHSIRDWNIALC